MDRVYVGSLRCGPAMRAISYRTSKGKRGPETYRHEFEETDGRGPYLLGEGFDGEALEVEALEVDEIAVLGRLIDVEFSDGARAVIAASPLLGIAGPLGRAGRLIILGAPFAVERRASGPFVTSHGIEG